ncbi:MAG: ion transporter [Candidatus Nanopelagicaceae bacterium]|jgi:voltage-gated sodium channel
MEPYRIKSLTRLVYSQPFELFIAGIILLNAVALALLTMPNIDGEARESLVRFDQIALWIFFFELVARMISYGRKPWMFFKTGWNVFDFIIIGLSPIFAGQTLILRLLRIFRLIRIFRFLPEVRILTKSITRSLPPLMSMSVLIFLALFIYGMAGVYLFGQEMPEQWGDITAALTSLFILLTLEEFANYLVDGLAVSPWALPFYISYVFVIVFTILNVLIGVVLNAMDEARQENREREAELEKLQTFAKEVEEISADGEITPEEVTQLKAKITTLERELKRLKGDE